MPSYTTQPAMIPGQLWRSLTTRYGISTEGEVYSRRSLLGVPRGEQYSVPVDAVTRTRCSGTLIGDVIFGEGSHDPVIWKSVLFPTLQLKRVRETISEFKKALAPPWHQGLELEDFVLVLPAIPSLLEQVFCNVFGTPFGVNVRELRKGEWVRKGGQIVRWTNNAAAPLLSPVDCQILRQGIESCRPQEFETSPAWAVTATAIRPVRDAPIEPSMYFSEVKKWVREFVDRSTKLNDVSSCIQQQDFREKLDVSVRDWASVPIKKLPLCSLEARLEEKWVDLPDFA